MKWGLSDHSIQEIHAILKKFTAVEKAVLYGSRAKGSFHKGSDIDLTLFGSAVDAETLLKISSELDSSSLPYECDISVFETLTDPDFIDHIKRVGVIFYEK